MAVESWLVSATKSLGYDPQSLGIEHPYGFVRAYYDQTDIVGNIPKPPGVPGSVRGPYPTMYATNPWTIRQYGGYGTPTETNQLYREVYANGGRGFSVAFDLPTHRGFDPGDPRVAPESGRSGVALGSAMDFALMFDGIPLEEVSISMTMNGAVLQSMASLYLTALSQGVDPKKVAGTIQNDPLKEFAARKTEIFPMDASMRVASDIIEFCTREMPKFNPISISGYHFQEKGAQLHEELAFMLADGIEYMRTMKDRGMKVDDFAPRLSFFYSVGIDFWGEVAKLRAGRLLWEKYATDAGATVDKAKLLRFHSHTSGVSLQEQDPYFNIIRATIESMAAVFGGTQSLHTSSFDEAVDLPSELGRRVSRATQLIIRDEAKIGQGIDPLGGSYFVESITDLMARSANKIVMEIEAMGGMRRAIESGYIEGLLAKSAAERQAAIDGGDQIVVGLNSFVQEGPSLEAQKIDASRVVREAKESLDFVRSLQDENVLGPLLDRLSEAARTGENLMPHVIRAMGDGRATWGQITQTLEKEFGRREHMAITSEGTYGELMQDNSEFVSAHTRSQTAAQAMNRKPRMLLVKFGQDGHDRGANFLAGGFRDLGFDVTWDGVISTTPMQAAQMLFENPDFDVVGVSSHSGAHLEYVGEMLSTLRELDPNRKPVVVVGGIIPSTDKTILKDMGVDLIYGPGTVISSAAQDIMDAMGIPPVVDSRNVTFAR